MNINLPFLLLTIPLIVGAVTHLLNRWVWAQSIIAGGAMLILALFAAQVPIGQTAIAFGREVVLQASWQVLGRTFNFASSDRPALLFGYLTATFFFFGAAATRVPRNFIPLACVLLSLLAATIFVEPFLFAALFLEIMAIAAAFLLCDPEFSNTRGAMRLLVLFSLGVPFILLAGWQLEGLLSNPENANLVESAILLLSIGFCYLTRHCTVPFVGSDSRRRCAFVLFRLYTDHNPSSCDVLFAQHIRTAPRAANKCDVINGAALGWHCIHHIGGHLCQRAAQLWAITGLFGVDRFRRDQPSP
jgi:hypothetical protein